MKQNDDKIRMKTKMYAMRAAVIGTSAFVSEFKMDGLGKFSTKKSFGSTLNPRPGPAFVGKKSNLELKFGM